MAHRALPARAPLAFALLCLAAALLAPPALARCLPVAGIQDAPRLWRVHDGVPGHTHRGGPSQDGGIRRVDDAKTADPKGTTGRGPALPAGTVELTFLGHASFLIRTHENVTAVTDYNGYVKADFVPDIVTMNRAHSTHYTDNVEPGVTHILKGWRENGVIPRHDVTLRDMRVTNVPTNIRGEMIGGDGFAGNSIFVFESAGMCIAHLGHLHHRLKPDHAGRVGSVDVMLAPIDGIYTMSQELLVQVIDDLKPQVVIPMHYGYGGTLERWVAMMRERKFDIREANSRSVRFSKVTLPGRPTVVVLQGGGY